MQVVIKIMEDGVEQLVIKAVLENDGVSSPHSTTKEAVPVMNVTASQEPATVVVELLKHLTKFKESLQHYGLDPNIVAQVFRQVCAEDLLYALK